MATPQEQVLGQINKAWGELQGTLGKVPQKRIEEEGVIESWSVKDMVGHMTSWEKDTMEKIQDYFRNGDAAVLDWYNVDEFNAQTTGINRRRSTDEILDDMKATHQKLIEFVQSLSEASLAIPEVEKRVRIDTFEHYHEHTEQIQKWLNRPSS